MSDKARRPLYERRALKQIMAARGIKYTAALRLFDVEKEKASRKDYNQLTFEQQQWVCEAVVRRLSEEQ